MNEEKNDLLPTHNIYEGTFFLLSFLHPQSESPSFALSSCLCLPHFRWLPDLPKKKSPFFFFCPLFLKMIFYLSDSMRWVFVESHAAPTKNFTILKSIHNFSTTMQNEGRILSLLNCEMFGRETESLVLNLAFCYNLQ